MTEQPRKILIVDDERFNINVLADLLKPTYKIMAAINGKQALKAARSDNPPDLILLDVMMPELDGYEVCRQLKADATTREIPVIFVTAMGQEADETKGLEIGAADYITKPISPAIVEARVRTQMERKQHLDELQRAYAIINAQNERMQEELNVGRDIQLSMLPQNFSAFTKEGGVQLHAAMQAAREVGGDLYDFFFIDDDHLCICVGDVSGKGVPAALFMAISKVLIRSRAADDLSPASILTHANDELAANNDAMMFVTVFLGILDRRTGELVYSNGGHNPPYIKRADGCVERLDQKHGPFLGPASGIAYKEDRLELGVGDSLFIYSDGVTEAINPSRAFYGDGRLEEFLDKGNFSDPEGLVACALQSVEHFADGAEQADDITLLVVSMTRLQSVDGVERFTKRIVNQLTEVGAVLADFSEFADSSGIDKAVAQKVNVAFDELLNNIISYGFPHGGEHEIDVEAERAADRLKITLVDDGIPFNPFQRQTPDLDSPLSDRQVGGLGIHIVRQLMDDVSYKRGVDRNIVTLIKLLDS
jgi:sigma-B regulation protein RsbU (phosphoserine phosphatase)